MPWLIASMLALGVVAAAGSAWAAVYVPGQYRDGVYTRPHFLDGPDARLRPEVKIETAGQGKVPKPIVIDEPLPAKGPPPESQS